MIRDKVEVIKEERLSFESTRNEKKYCTTHLDLDVKNSKFYAQKI